MLSLDSSPQKTLLWKGNITVRCKALLFCKFDELHEKIATQKRLSQSHQDNADEHSAHVAQTSIATD